MPIPGGHRDVHSVQQQVEVLLSPELGIPAESSLIHRVRPGRTSEVMACVLQTKDPVYFQA